jgi:hypothetical protein
MDRSYFWGELRGAYVCGEPERRSHFVQVRFATGSGVGGGGEGGRPEALFRLRSVSRSHTHTIPPIYLPRLLLKLNPDTVPTFNRNPTHISKKMENVTIFLRGCRTLGLADFELFSTADLVEEKNIMSVANTIHALGRLMQSSKYAHMNFPTLGKKAAEKNVRQMRRSQPGASERLPIFRA